MPTCSLEREVKGNTAIQLRGLRQHQERLFACFGVDPSHLGRGRAPMSGVAPSARAATSKEVA